MGTTGRMGGFLRGLDAWLEREPDVCAEAADEVDDDGDETNEDDEPGDGFPLPAAIAH